MNGIQPSNAISHRHQLLFGKAEELGLEPSRYSYLRLLRELHAAQNQPAEDEFVASSQEG